MPLLSRAIPCLMAALLVIAAGEPPGNEIVAQRGDVRMTGAEVQELLNLLDPAARAQVTANAQTLGTFVRDRMLNLSVAAEVKVWLCARALLAAGSATARASDASAAASGAAAEEPVDEPLPRRNPSWREQLGHGCQPLSACRRRAAASWVAGAALLGRPP